MINRKPSIYCFVTNDLNQDQRMHRICTTIAEMGYEVILTGRKKKHSEPILDFPFIQRRLDCFFNHGPLFYLEYNIRICLLLMRKKPDVIYSVDTDTLPGCTMAKLWTGKKMIFDSHEYYSESPELTSRPIKRSIWKWVEKIAIPRADKAITVNQSLSDLLSKKYKNDFIPVYNVPFKEKGAVVEVEKSDFILYQGVLNQGRGLEEMILAMQWIQDARLVIAGEGDLSQQLRAMAAVSPVKDRITFMGWLTPGALSKLTRQALLGVNLLDGSSLNYYYSLANKFFDYMHAGVPSLNMDFPEYHRMIEQYDTGYLLDNLTPESLAATINNILNDQAELERKKAHCYLASEDLNWENEAVKIKNLLSDLMESKNMDSAI